MSWTWTMPVYAAPVPASPSLTLDASLAARFIAAMREKGNSLEWVQKQAAYLHWWQEKFDGRNLKSLALIDLKGFIHGVPGKRHCVEVVKAFFSWLRSEGRLPRGEDATLDLHVPPARPAQWTASKV